MDSVTQLLCKYAHSHLSNETAYRFFKGGTLDNISLTYYDLWQHASAIAHQWQSKDITNQNILIACKNAHNFVISFYACLLSGNTAVPTVPIKPNRMDRFTLLSNDCNARIVLVDYDVEYNNIHSLEWINIPNYVSASDISEFSNLLKSNSNRISDIAFLQYTSGSTGNPKGVIISHENIIHNCAAIQQAMQVTSDSAFLTAIPLFHDMGLVGGILSPMYNGCIGNFMEPSEFVKYPHNWLKIIDQHNITICGGPNYLYDLACRDIDLDRITEIDLSNWTVAYCGAEPIRPATITEFTTRFSNNGFQPEAFYPCYGLAESTLFVTGHAIGTIPNTNCHHGTTSVNCGTTYHDTEVAIVDPISFNRHKDGEIGEIWVSGKSVSKGYWHNPYATSRAFHNTITEESETKYLRTGDLGFIECGKLFVTGRIKDLIIINGNNYAPQDLEFEVMNKHKELRQAGTAAISVANEGGQDIILISELKRTWLKKPEQWKAIKTAIKTSIYKRFGIIISYVLLIRPGSLPRTSSGKVRRATCAEHYSSKQLMDVETKNVKQPVDALNVSVN